MGIDNQGRRAGEGKLETPNQRPRENSGDSSGKGSKSGSATSGACEDVKKKVHNVLNP